jgi:hypothetical protein
MISSDIHGSPARGIWKKASSHLDLSTAAVFLQTAKLSLEEQGGIKYLFLLNARDRLQICHHSTSIFGSGASMNFA